MTDDSVVVAAPTGSGKTVIFELAIVRLLENHWPFNENNFKIVYMAPIKALCSERYSDWNKKFYKIGLKCLELTGDSDEDLFSIDGYHLILTTPEKWDSLTRKWKENNFPVQKVKLFMIDEVHLLNEEKRGPTLEAVVCRMKLAQNLAKSCVNIRFIAVSATIPNVQDITEWLSSDRVKAKNYQIGEESRPVALTKVVLGYPVKEKQSPYMFDISLNYKLKSLVVKYAKGKPSLIFCNTRKGVLQAANILSKELSISMSAAQREVIHDTVKKIQEGGMKNLLRNGIGCHHAGLLVDDRRLIEGLFRSGYLPVLVATSTLAMGINLPAHLVIIKSTEYYVNGRYQEYSESQVLQMIGRAGRPQFDTEAIAVIMTKDSQKKRFENLIDGVQAVESNLHRHLTEHLNAEVVLRTIPDIAFAMDWIRSTFLYVRTQKSPSHYKLPCHLTKVQMEKRLQDWCLRELNGLVRYKLATLTDGYEVSPTTQGTIMAQYCISFETMKLFMKVKGTESLSELLNIFVEAQEFKDIVLRVNERKTLNSLNKPQGIQKLRFPLQGKIKSHAMKVNCLVQATFGCLQIFDAALMQDRAKILRVGKRLTQGLVQLLWLQDDAYRGLLSAIILAKCFFTQLWEDSEHISRQLPGIGPVLSSHLVAGRKVTFRDLLDSNPRDLELMLNRHPPFGNSLLDAVRKLPQFEIELYTPDDQGTILVEVEIINYADLLKSKNLQDMFYLLIGNSKNRILHKSKFSLDSLIKRGGFYKFSLVADDCGSSPINAHILSKNWAGLDVNKTLGESKSDSPQSGFDENSANKDSEKSTSSKRKRKMSNGASNKKVTRAKVSGFSTLKTSGVKDKFPMEQGQTTLTDYLVTPSKKLNKPIFDAQEQLENDLCNISISDSVDDQNQQNRDDLTTSQNTNVAISENGMNKESPFPAKTFQDPNNSFVSVFNQASKIPAESSSSGRCSSVSAKSDASTSLLGISYKGKGFYNIFEDLKLKDRISTDAENKFVCENMNMKSEIRDILDLEYSKIFSQFNSILKNSSRKQDTSENPTVPNSSDKSTHEPNASKPLVELFSRFNSVMSSSVENGVMAKTKPEEIQNGNNLKNKLDNQNNPFMRTKVLSNTDQNFKSFLNPTLDVAKFCRQSSLDIDETNNCKPSLEKELVNMQKNNQPSQNMECTNKYEVDDEEFEDFLKSLHEDAEKSTQSPTAYVGNTPNNSQFGSSGTRFVRIEDTFSSLARKELCGSKDKFQQNIPVIEEKKSNPFSATRLNDKIGNTSSFGVEKHLMNLNHPQNFGLRYENRLTHPTDVNPEVGTANKQFFSRPFERHPTDPKSDGHHGCINTGFTADRNSFSSPVKNHQCDFQEKSQHSVPTTEEKKFNPFTVSRLHDSTGNTFVSPFDLEKHQMNLNTNFSSRYENRLIHQTDANPKVDSVDKQFFSRPLERHHPTDSRLESQQVVPFSEQNQPNIFRDSEVEVRPAKKPFSFFASTEYPNSLHTVSQKVVPFVEQKNIQHLNNAQTNAHMFALRTMEKCPVDLPLQSQKNHSIHYREKPKPSSEHPSSKLQLNEKLPNASPITNGTSFDIIQNYNSQEVPEKEDHTVKSQKLDPKNNDQRFMSSRSEVSCASKLSVDYSNSERNLKTISNLTSRKNRSSVTNMKFDALQKVESCNILKLIEEKINGSQQATNNSNAIDGKQNGSFKFKTPSRVWKTPIHPSSNVLSAEVQRKEKLSVNITCERNQKPESMTVQPCDNFKTGNTMQAPKPSQSALMLHGQKTPFENITSSENKSPQKNSTHPLSSKNDDYQSTTFGQASRLHSNEHKNICSKGMEIKDFQKKDVLPGAIRSPKLKMFSLKKGYKSNKMLKPNLNTHNLLKTTGSCQKYGSRPKDSHRSDDKSTLNTPASNSSPNVSRTVSSRVNPSKANQNRFLKFSFGKSSNSQKEKRQKKSFIKSVKTVNQQNEDDFSPFEVESGLICTKILGPETNSDPESEPLSRSSNEVDSHSDKVSDLSPENFDRVDNSDFSNHVRSQHCSLSSLPLSLCPLETQFRMSEKIKATQSNLSFTDYQPMHNSKLMFLEGNEPRRPVLKENSHQFIDNRYNSENYFFDQRKNVSNEMGHFTPNNENDFQNSRSSDFPNSFYSRTNSHTFENAPPNFFSQPMDRFENQGILNPYPVQPFGFSSDLDFHRTGFNNSSKSLCFNNSSRNLPSHALPLFSTQIYAPVSQPVLYNNPAPIQLSQRQNASIIKPSSIDFGGYLTEGNMCTNYFPVQSQYSQQFFPPRQPYSSVFSNVSHPPPSADQSFQFLDTSYHQDYHL